jgi:hypothetical protein
LRLRFDNRSEVHEAFLSLVCADLLARVDRLGGRWRASITGTDLSDM